MSGTRCLVTQSCATGGNQSYPDFWVITGGIWYPGYKTPTILKPRIVRNVEAYIGNVVVKLKKCGNLLDDLKETFDNIHKCQMKLKSKKCVFGVSLG
jgi:hypothetical protein